MAQEREVVKPTNPGWYFAKMTYDEEMQCVEVDIVNSEYVVYITGDSEKYSLNQFHWFGKVNMPPEI